MVVNDSVGELVGTLLQQTKVGEYANNILLGLGGIASATFIYFCIMIYFKYKEYKLHEETIKKLEIQSILLKHIYDKFEEIENDTEK